MGIDTQHPSYTEKAPDWQLMSDTFAGERAVKDAGDTYLPPTSGMREDGLGTNQPGAAAYEAYVSRAVFHDYVKEAVRALAGVMHRKAPIIELPARLQGMIEKATPEGESLAVLLRRMNEHQLLYGRVGILGEIPTGLGPDLLPFIATYAARAIVNWDNGSNSQGEKRLELVVLDESGPQRTSNFEWEDVESFRVLSLSTVASNIAQEDQEQVGEGAYVVATASSDDDPASLTYLAPKLAGKVLNEIPFSFVGTKDLVPEPDEPPLLGLANLAIAIYRGEADYRQNLFMQGQETFVTIGAEDSTFGASDVRTGAGARIDVPLGGDAKYVGVSASGLGEQRQALEADKQLAEAMGGKLLSQPGNPQQSGDALRVRVAAQTATLTSIAIAGAAALTDVLQKLAVWAGANPDEVVVKPNLEFADVRMTGDELMKIMQAKKLGAPLDDESVHRLMVIGGMTVKEFDEERDNAEEELQASLDNVGGGVPGAPGGGLDQPVGAADPNNPQGVDTADNNPDSGNG